MGKRQEKTTAIIQQTIGILCTEGAGGLSMRRVAKAAGIRLSNLQYYYKDKTALLEATIAYYFQQNEQQVIQQMAALPSNTAFIPLLRTLLSAALIDGTDNERCAMFREIWALATKMPSVSALVKQYYHQHNQWLITTFASYSPRPDILVSLLMPYVEGYSLMGNALPVEKDVIIEELINMILPYCHPSE